TFRGLAPELVGRKYVGLTGCSLDVSDASRAHLERIERFGDAPVVARTASMRMVELQHLGDAGDAALAGMPRYMKGEMMRELTDEMIAGIASRAVEMPTRRTIYEMGMQGGAMAEVGEMEMAVGMRDAAHLGGWSVMGEPGEDIGDAIQWAREAWSVLAPGSCGGTYLNFDGEADEGRVLGSLSADRGDAKRERLAAIKRTWDPGNRFHVNHNIRPA
ncbi:MAG TPA: BBE domain-containing protein, partial [Solirubrobacterales bacterium]|nr:BBE domain-containing protein [Solirubrobacterales bacterium]